MAEYTEIDFNLVAAFAFSREYNLRFIRRLDTLLSSDSFVFLRTRSEASLRVPVRASANAMRYESVLQVLQGQNTTRFLATIG